MKIINLSSGLLHCYQSTTQCISVFSGQMKVMAMNQLTQRPTHSFLMSEWLSSQLSFSYHSQNSRIPPDFIYFIKSESKIKFQGCKETKAKCQPDLITVNYKQSNPILTRHFKSVEVDKLYRTEFNWPIP